MSPSSPTSPGKRPRGESSSPCAGWAPCFRPGRTRAGARCGSRPTRPRIRCRPRARRTRRRCLRGAIVCASPAAPRGAELDEDRPGVTRRVPLGDGPDPGGHRWDDTCALDCAKPPDLPGRLLGSPLGPRVDAGPRSTVENLRERVHDAGIALPYPGGAARGSAARRPHPAYAQGPGEVVPDVWSGAAGRPGPRPRAGPRRGSSAPAMRTASAPAQVHWPRQRLEGVPVPGVLTEIPPLHLTQEVRSPACPLAPARTWASRLSP